MIFKIFILQTFCKNMSSMTDIFSSPFTLIKSVSYHHPCEGLKVKFKTNDIHDSTTAEEVYILSKKYLDDIISQYKNYYFGDNQAKESYYRLYIGMVKDYEFNEYNVYSINYDNIKNKISNENKYSFNFEIEGDFNIFINVTTKWWEDYDSESEDEDEEPTRKTISEPECIICFEKTPNILHLECLHLCVCNDCDIKGKFHKCPMCRTKIKNNKIRII